MPHLSPAEIVRTLGLRPHPEGGHYVEMFRDAPLNGRAASTAIYFMLTAGEASKWHTVDAAEVWHFYAGDPLELTIKQPGQPPDIRIVGADLVAGQRPQAVVPAGAWQMARPLGSWVLVGCTVAPGFEFASFKLAENGFDPLTR
jgi:predicted cupin superfamily sugar epimerase